MSYLLKTGSLYARENGQLENINILVGETDEAVKAIEQKAQEVISSIPEDYTGLIAEVAKKAELTKLYFDGAEIFRDEAHWEEYIPMTFDEIWDLCHDERNFVYIGDGQMKYYPQLDLNVSSKPESITFISTAQLDGKNNHTRIIINENNEVKTNQVIDTPWFDFVAEQKKVAKLQKDLAYANKRIENLEYGMPGYTSESDDDVLQTKVVPANAFPNASFDVIGGKSVVVNQLLLEGNVASNTEYGVTFTNNADGTFTVVGTKDASQPRARSNSLNYKVMQGDGHKYYYGSNSKTGNVKVYKNTYGGYAVKEIFTATTAYNVHLVVADNIAVNETVRPFCVDLTLMFGSGNEPTSVDDPRIARLDEYLEKHPEYNAGSISSAPVDSVVSVGKNLLKNELVSGTVSGITYIHNADNSITVSGSRVGGQSIVVGSAELEPGSYIYELYGENSGLYARRTSIDGAETQSSFPMTIQVDTKGRYTFLLKGKQDGVQASGTFFVQLRRADAPTGYIPYREPIDTPIPSAILALPDYGIGVSDSVYNYVDYNEKKYHRRVGSVDLGTLNWTKSASIDSMFYSRDIPYGDVLCSAYSYRGATRDGDMALYDKVIATNYDKTSGIKVRDTLYSTAPEFKTAMDGVMLHYELAEEEIIDLSNILSDGDNIIPVEGGGTVTMHLPDENYAVDMPNTVTYDVKVGA